MPVKIECKTNESIGQTGNSGHSFGRHLHFTLLDDLFNSYNPMVSELIPEDKSPPAIGDVLLKINN
jgi:murein DD-endopeptidase MepM/ murein hydrolase activator NlpD